MDGRAMSDLIALIDLAEDRHVHSTFSDGADTLECNLAAARLAGLHRLGCVDHVRRDSDYVGRYVQAVRALSSDGVVLTAGLEAKILDADGALDMPDTFSLADAVYIADHQMPTRDGPRSPRAIRDELSAGRLLAADAIELIVVATERALRRYAGTPLVIAHLFSILPKIGVEEAAVPSAAIARLATAAADVGALIEVSERWRCPSIDTVRVFHRHGVTIVASTDSHRAETIGCYDYVRWLAAACSGDA